jgi:hypothetical protein
MTSRQPTQAELNAAKREIPVHHPATSLYRESWSVRNPRGSEIHYGSRDEAETAARTGIY